jgi:hypothetical protein
LCVVALNAAGLLFAGVAAAQQEPALQPFAQMVRRLEDALNYVGQPLPLEVHKKINDVVAMKDERQAVAELPKLLDPYVLAEVHINPESRVKVTPGQAKPELVENGTRIFLVKVMNQAAVTAPLEVESPNSGPVFLRSQGEAEPKMELTQQDVNDRWADISVYNKPPMGERLLGLGIEYQILEIYSRDRGQRSAKIAFNVGQGTQDIGFRNDILVLFNIEPARPVTLRVRNEKGEPSFAGFTVRDLQGRLYPSPSKRLAPDFPFQQQVYRTDGEKLFLPPGYYTIEYSGGPEYFKRTKEVPLAKEGPEELSFQLQRWIDPANYGWWSGDHHVHAAGCQHYKNPTEGVTPEDMLRQALGENLAVSAVLTWGPSWYYQKQYFSGKDHPQSKSDRIIHYDIEVSMFPSSHAGHLVLLGLKEDDYPGTTRMEEWPSWNIPVLKWAKSQGAVTGYTHSGSGLQVRTDKLPNYDMPGFDGIGANEFIVNVTHPDTIDFISAVDTPWIWEMNIWYHTLNSGFRTRISGETDFPCIYGERIGMGRSYVKLDKLDYRRWADGLRDGRTYVSDGFSHLMDFTVNGVELGTKDSEIQLKAGENARVEVKVAAYLERFPDPKFADLPYMRQPYWNIERARVPQTREVPVELVVNGEAVARKTVLADGQVRDLSFDTPLKKSSWIALRIPASSHTNPIFAIVDGKPIRASRRSAEWCLAAVNQCWTQKVPQIREPEREAARQAYDHARQVFKQRIEESSE